MVEDDLIPVSQFDKEFDNIIKTFTNNKNVDDDYVFVNDIDDTTKIKQNSNKNSILHTIQIASIPMKIFMEDLYLNGFKNYNMLRIYEQFERDQPRSKLYFNNNKIKDAGQFNDFLKLNYTICRKNILMLCTQAVLGAAYIISAKQLDDKYRLVDISLKDVSDEKQWICGAVIYMDAEIGKTIKFDIVKFFKIMTFIDDDLRQIGSVYIKMHIPLDYHNKLNDNYALIDIKYAWFDKVVNT